MARDKRFLGKRVPAATTGTANARRILRGFIMNMSNLAVTWRNPVAAIMFSSFLASTQLLSTAVQA